jgi:hypothetical protein
MLKLRGIMRVSILIFLLLLCQSYAHAYQFVFKTGKSVEGTILYEDSSIYRIRDTSGIEMRIRKNELNYAATESANIAIEKLSPPASNKADETPVSTSRQSHVYTNADLHAAGRIAFAPSDPGSETAWRAHILKLEREFARQQGACRAAGGGPNFSKVLRTHTYRVNGKSVRVTGYWADPANIENAKEICRRALQTEEVLNEAHRQFNDFQTQKSSRGR